MSTDKTSLSTINFEKIWIFLLQTLQAKSFLKKSAFFLFFFVGSLSVGFPVQSLKWGVYSYTIPQSVPVGIKTGESGREFTPLHCSSLLLRNTTFSWDNNLLWTDKIKGEIFDHKAHTAFQKHFKPTVKHCQYWRGDYLSLAALVATFAITESTMNICKWKRFRVNWRNTVLQLKLCQKWSCHRTIKLIYNSIAEKKKKKMKELKWPHQNECC